MFTQLIFLIVVLLIVNFSGEIHSPKWIACPWDALILGFFLYLLLLGIIFWQNRSHRVSKSLLLLITNLELLLFLSLLFFVLGAQRALVLIPFVKSSQALEASIYLGLYLGGLGFFHYTWSKLRHISDAANNSTQQVRLIVPFAIPFIFFLLALDIASSNKAMQNLLSNENILLIVSLSFMTLMLLFLPPLVIRIWQCVPMEENALKKRLEEICKKANFKHNGILDWTILNRFHTAAILGILPSFRYVLFTKKLQQDLPEESIEAILAHEIGHSKRKHLLIYPLIIFGMVVCIGFYAYYGAPLIDLWFNSSSHIIMKVLHPFAIVIPYAIIIGAYLRYIFGFFSRLFERQADLHCFELNIPADSMIRALDDVAVATGFTHQAPNWHHYSIQERMNFLEKAKKDSQVITAHHSKVKIIIWGYLLALTLASAVLFLT